MTFVSVAESCRRLGSDPKTLRRWLAQAQLPLQRHPVDGRLRGVSEEQVQRLARLHHRALAPVVQDEPPRTLTAEPASVPTDLLTLPETMSLLQAQIVALQQQVSALIALLEQHVQPAVVPASVVEPVQASSQARPVSAVAPTPPRKPIHVLPRVEASKDGGYVVFCPTQGRLALEPESPPWFAWLETLTSFRFVGRQGSLTVHRERKRVAGVSWRAHRKLRNHTSNLHLGQTEELTIAVLEQAAQRLLAHLK